MIFSSYPFILLFFPIVTGIYWILCRFRFFDMAKIWLVLASFFFYAQGSPAFFPFFLGSVMANYVCGITLCRLQGEGYKVQRTFLLILGVAGNVALLGYYKYANFLVENFNLLGGTNLVWKKVVLPIGISFFTFQLIAFLVDCCRGDTKRYDILEYLLFITFFPQLIVGPIVHHSEITPQFADERNLKLNHENIALGIFIFSIGCAKKMLLADPMNETAAAFYSSISEGISIWESWFYSLQYSLSYYFDLSGYTDMAIGLALFYNIHLPDNFNAPFKARNMQDYWQRHHITLSRFLGSYVFRNVYRKGSRWRNFYVATMVTFLVSGIWHGAGWNFIVWGLINGVLVCIGAYENYHKKHPPLLIGAGLTFICIILTRVIFVASSMSDVMTVYRSMFDFRALFANGAAGSLFRFVRHHSRQGLMVAVSLAICWFAPTTRQLAARFKANAVSLVYAALLFGYCLLRMNQVVQFLYFQF